MTYFRHTIVENGQITNLAFDAALVNTGTADALIAACRLMPQRNPERIKKDTLLPKPCDGLEPILLKPRDIKQVTITIKDPEPQSKEEFTELRLQILTIDSKGRQYDTTFPIASWSRSEPDTIDHVDKYQTIELLQNRDFPSLHPAAKR